MGLDETWQVGSRPEKTKPCTVFEPHCGPFASNLDKLLTYGVLRSTRPPPFTGREMSSSLRVWPIRAVVCLYAATRVQLFASAGNG